MSFTYSEDLTNDVDYCRFHIGDTIQAQSILSDEVITSLIAVEGSKQRAVIAGLEYKLDQMNNPEFRADWLTVKPEEAVKALERRLSRKRSELGVPRYTASVTHVYRADSAQTEESDYTDGRP